MVYLTFPLALEVFYFILFQSLTKETRMIIESPWMKFVISIVIGRLENTERKIKNFL